MEKSFHNSGDTTKEFYYYLGLLSTKFATLENNIMSILGKLITDEIFLINTIIEKNSLSQNIELLKKINLYKEFETESITKLLENISSFRQERNLFIHALWGNPYIRDGDVMIDCLETKISPKITKYGRMWASAREHQFKLSHLIKRIEEIDSAIALQKTLLEKL